MKQSKYDQFLRFGSPLGWCAIMLSKFDSSGAARLGVLLMGYVVVLFSALFLAYELRFDFAVPVGFQTVRNHWVALVVLVQVFCLAGFRQFGSLLTYFSVPDLARIAGALCTSNAVFVIWWYLSSGLHAPPRGVVLADFVFAVAGMSFFRLGLRLYRERFASAGDTTFSGVRPRRILIVGAGDVGARLVQEAASRPRLGLTPVCFLDDDETKHGRRIHGVPVAGVPEDIVRLASSHKIDSVVIAMPSAAAKRVRDLVQLAYSAQLKVDIVPSMSELTSGRVQVSRIRPVDVEDLLGRDPVLLDSKGIRKSILRRVVLVTGAGGSIGSELCRQIGALAPQRLLMVDQSEGALFMIEQEMNDLGLGSLAVPLVGDILDEERMRYIFFHYRPEVVFHAAAHKHVSMMERQPAEAIRNNVLGTRLLAHLALEAGTENFVLISTDKAINPTNVMGATKRLAEMQMFAVSRGEPDGAPTGFDPPRGRTRFMAVRFGNVLGSSGSVVQIFKRQIAHGGPVTVTHPDVTRYFMTIPEAVGLVMQASILGAGGEIFILDMGQAVKIFELAKQMIELSGFKVGEDIEIKFTGLKPGEKLFEELQHASEEHTPTNHPRIMRLVPRGSWDGDRLRELEQRLYEMDSNQLKGILKKLVPEYVPYLD